MTEDATCGGKGENENGSDRAEQLYDPFQDQRSDRWDSQQPTHWRCQRGGEIMHIPIVFPADKARKHGTGKGNGRMPGRTG